MSFLAPLFMLGALAVGLPVLFHLTRKSTRRKQTFSSLMFLRPTPPRLTRRNRLEHLLLLLMRCAVIAMLAFAFARPFLQEPPTIIPQTSPPQRWVLLLDTSASLQREGLWTQAESEFRRALGELTADDEVAVMTFDRQVRTMLTFDQWRSTDPAEREALALAIWEQVKPGWASTRLDLALTAAAEMLDEADVLSSDAVLRRIRVITDLQSGARLANLQQYHWPAGIEVIPNIVRPALPGNAGLQWMVLGPTALSDGEPVPTRVRVINAADSRQDQFEISWVRSGDREPVRLQVPPGQTRVYTLPMSTQDALGGRAIRLKGDGVDFDNTLYLTPAPTDERRIGFWGGDEVDNSERLAFYLKRAFPEVSGRGVQLVFLSADTDWAESDAAGAGLGLVIMAGDVPVGRTEGVRRWVDRGGTLFWVLDSPSDAEALRLWFQTDSLRVREAVVDGYALLGQIEFSHPLFAPFADPRYSDFTKIHFWQHRQVNFEAIAEARVLARFDGGAAALVEVPWGRGRVMIMTAGWHPADGQLALSTKFVPLLHALVDYAMGAKSQQAQYYVGDTVLLRGGEGGTGKITSPDLNVVEPADGRFDQTLVPGVYTVNEGPVTWQFAVNVDPAEAQTAPLPEDDLERMGVPLRGAVLESPRIEERQRRWREVEMEDRQKLWRWLILGALVVLGLESWLAGRSAPGRIELEGRP